MNPRNRPRDRKGSSGGSSFPGPPRDPWGPPGRCTTPADPLGTSWAHTGDFLGSAGGSCGTPKNPLDGLILHTSRMEALLVAQRDALVEPGTIGYQGGPLPAPSVPRTQDARYIYIYIYIHISNLVGIPQAHVTSQGPTVIAQGPFGTL